MAPEELESPFVSSELVSSEQESAPPGAFLVVEDELGRPLGDGKYAFVQELVTSGGELEAGRAAFGKIDPRRPFYFAVEGRVCAIRAGAYLDPDKQHVQYGGTWFDWTLVRDDKPEAAEFWRHYERELLGAGKPFAVDRFWQHEHITRREIQIAKSHLRRLEQVRIRAVPARIRVGPFVRYTDHERAVIWLETLTPCLVKVAYRKPGQTPLLCVVPTVRVGGRYYGVVELERLSQDCQYEYTVELAPLPVTGLIPQTPEALERAFPKLSASIKACQAGDLKDLRIGKEEWLSFRTLVPKYARELRFVTGSCRWYPADVKHGKDFGPDMLAGLCGWLRREPRSNWPAFALFSGDQIYSDECGDDTSARLREGRLAACVPGPRQAGKIRERLIDGAWAGRFAHRYKPNGGGPKLLAQLKGQLEHAEQIHRRYPDIAETVRDNPGVAPKEQFRRAYLILGGTDHRRQREVWAELETLKQLEITAKPLKAHYEHWRAAEQLPSWRTRFLAHNFLLWQLPVLENELPTVADSEKFPVARHAELRGHDAAAGGVHAADYAEYASLYERAWTSSSDVRAVLAHLPTFLMFDDHELTDDWNFDVSWVRMLHNPKDDFALWPKTLTDALAAYWVYQGYGNKAPSQWSADDPRVKALRTAAASGGDALPALRECIYRACYGRPPEQGAKAYQSGTTLDWHYQLPFEPVFLVPDCRSRKRLVASDERLRTIEHDGPRAPQSQTIDDAQLKWLREKLASSSAPVAFVTTSTPVLLQKKAMDAMLRPETLAALASGDWGGLPAAVLDSTKLGFGSDDFLRAFRRTRDVEHMLRDKTWRDVWQLTELLAQKHSLKTLVFVSGDVHHSYCMSATKRGQTFPEVLQVTSSGLQTEERATSNKERGERLGDSPFDIGQVHVKPGFVSKEGKGAPDLVLYQNTVALVRATWGKDVTVQVEFLSGSERHLFRYDSPRATTPARELEERV